MIVKEIKIGEYRGFNFPVPDFDIECKEEAVNMEINLINNIVRKILDNCKITYNEDLVVKEAEIMRKDLEDQLASGDLNLDVYMVYHGIDNEEALMESLKEEVRTTYLEITCFEEIASREKISLTDEEIIAASSEYDADSGNIKGFHKGLLIKKVVHDLIKMNVI